MLIYVNLCKLVVLLSLNVSETTSIGVKNLGVDTKNIVIGDFVEKLEDFIFFRLELC